MSRYVLSPRAKADLDEIWEYTSKTYYRYLAGSHIIYFRKIKSGIDVVRIPHGGMDFERHL